MLRMQPNKWELLSLLIDTPVSKVEEQAILDKLDGLEQLAHATAMSVRLATLGLARCGLSDAAGATCV